jgi:predicted dehydrogenase
MAAAAARSGLIAKIGFLFRHSPVVTRMRAQFIDPFHPLHWKMQRKHAPGGVYVEYGAHTIDLALWFGGPIARVVGHGVTLIPERPLPDGGSAPVDLDDVASWIGTYASGGEALFRSGWASLPAGSGGMRVFGDRGTLYWQQTGRQSEALIAATPDDPESRTLYEFNPPPDPATAGGVFPLGIYSHYNRRLAESFVHDIRAGRTTWPTFANGLAAQRVLHALGVSLAEQRWVDVPD